MHERRKFGNLGEEMAAAYLEKKGFVILDAQWKHRFGEIDLVVREGTELVFVEVKSRKSTTFGYPEASVTATKLRKLQMLAEAYVTQAGWMGKYRIDVVGILMRGEVAEYQHLIGV